MPQTNDGMSFAEADVYFSTDGSTWQDFSGWTTAVSLGGGEIQSAETYTAEGEGAIITLGKRQPLDITARMVYTEGSADPFEVLRAAYENKTDLYIRWIPAGSVASNFQFTSSAGKVLTPPYPGGEVDGGEAILVEGTIKASTVTKSAVS
jgi:hypothetical protein